MSAVAMPASGARRRLRDHRYRSHYAAQTLAERKPRERQQPLLGEGSKRDECLTTEQVPEVIGVRLMLGVGGYCPELTTEKIKSSPHGFDLVRAEPTCE